jgi:hypothetical protein
MLDFNAIKDSLDKQIGGKKSISVDRSTSKILESVRNKYSKDYISFLNGIEEHDTKDKEPFYRELRAQMRRTVELCDILLGKTKRLATEPEVEEFLKMTASVEAGIAAIHESTKNSQQFADKVSGVESSTNMNLNMMKNYSKMLSENMKKRASRKGGLSDVLNDTGYVFGGFGKGESHSSGGLGGTLALALGPMAPFAHYALTAGKEVLKRYKEKKMARQMSGGEVGLIAKEFGMSEEEYRNFSMGKQGGTNVHGQFSSVNDMWKQFDKKSQGGQPSGGNTRSAMNEQLRQAYEAKYGSDYSSPQGSSAPSAISQASSKEQGAIPQVSPVELMRGQGVGKYTTNTAVAAGLKSFFTTGAFQAPYTKKLLEILQDKGGGSGFNMSFNPFSAIGNMIKGAMGAIGGAVGGLITGVGRALGSGFGSAAAGGALGSALAVGGAGLAGWGLGRAIGEHTGWGGQSTDKHVQGFWSDTIFGAQNRKAQAMNNAADITDPKMRQKIALQQKGMTPQQAYQAVYGGGVATQAATAKSAPETVSSIPTKVSDIDNKIKSLKDKNNNDELTGALKEMAKDKSKSGAMSIESGGDSDKSDPFLDYLNSGLLNEEW